MIINDSAPTGLLADPNDDYAALYYPGHHSQLPDLTPRERKSRRLFGRINDQENQPPDVQLELCETERRDLELWRNKASRLIEERIFSFRHCTNSAIPTPGNPSSTRAEHYALQVAELLDSILCLVEPQDHLTAWNVSRVWRASCKAVIETKAGDRTFWDIFPCAPVSYGQIFDLSVTWLQPTHEELIHFEVEVQDSISRARRAYYQGFKTLYFPARFTQQPSLSDALIHMLDSLDERQNLFAFRPAPKPIPASRQPHGHWLDFSQLQINPHLEAIFCDRLSVRRGKIEIALRPSHGPLGLLLEPEVSLTFLNSIGHMFATQPPCRSMGIYCVNPGRTRTGDGSGDCSDLEFLARISDDEGIRVSHLLRLLRAHCFHITSLWLDQAEQLKQQVQAGHWIDDVWNIPGRPKFIILLDNPDMVEGIDIHWHITRWAFLASTGFRAERQSEWMPMDLIEPSKTTTIRHQVNWDS